MESFKLYIMFRRFAISMKMEVFLVHSQILGYNME